MLEVIGFEASDDQPVNTVNQTATVSFANKTKLFFHHCRENGQYRNQWRQLKKVQIEIDNKNTNDNYDHIYQNKIKPKLNCLRSMWKNQNTTQRIVPMEPKLHIDYHFGEKPVEQKVSQPQKA